MKIKRDMIKKTVLMVLAFAIISGSILLRSMTSFAAPIHQANCNQVLYYEKAFVSKSSYTHNSQYGLCYVVVTEVFNRYVCNCGASITEERIDRHETHNQPHG